MNEQHPAHQPPAGGEVETRRRFFASFLSVIIGGALALVPIVTGVVFFFDPILRKRKTAAGGAAEGAPGEGYFKVTSESAIPDDGTPVFQEVRKDVIDAWNKYLNQPVGSVYLRKTEDGSVTCFSTECPHLGCAVSYLETDDARGYKCPCHDSSFQLNGEKTNNIPPRDLDELDVKVAENGDVWVKFQSFKIGTEEKIPKS